jgi:predicted SprT family Zn-dependent metalloprotease
VRIANVSPAVEELASIYVHRLGLVGNTVWLTEDRRQFEAWLGRPVGSAIGGAYAYLSRSGAHAVLIHTSRIDLDKPRSLEIVVCEEFLHMRHWLDGDRRRHSHHGYDRIAVQVAQLTGATMEEVRNCLKPILRRPFRYLYACPACGIEVPRRRRGTWSCGRCAPSFSHEHVLVLRRAISGAPEPGETP